MNVIRDMNGNIPAYVIVGLTIVHQSSGMQETMQGTGDQYIRPAHQLLKERVKKWRLHQKNT